MRRLICCAVAVAAGVAVATPAAAAPVPGGSGCCAAFGANVASLATTLGGQFGAVASSVASSGPRAFPTVVVGPEQLALCP